MFNPFKGFFKEPKTLEFKEEKKKEEFVPAQIIKYKPVDPLDKFIEEANADI